MDWCTGEGVSSLSIPFAQLCAFSTSNEAHTFQKTPGSHCGWGSSQVPSTKVALEHVWHAIISIPIGAGERTPDLQALMLVGPACCLQPQCQPGMALPHPGVTGGWAPVAGDTPDLHLLQLHLALTNQPLHVAPSQSAMLAGAASGLIYTGITFWALFCL